MHKRINILFTIFFAWSALFGALGGLLICIHESFQAHVVVEDHEGECETSYAASKSSDPRLEESNTCLDIEIDTIQTNLAKPQVSTSNHLLVAANFLEKTNFDFSPALRELAPDLQPQASPALTAVSVQTVQLAQLRI
jgi:D-alanine-D-alanine ligase-like ATP-grasp enzyme